MHIQYLQIQKSTLTSYAKSLFLNCNIRTRNQHFQGLLFVRYHLLCVLWTKPFIPLFQKFSHMCMPRKCSPCPGGEGSPTASWSSVVSGTCRQPLTRVLGGRSWGHLQWKHTVRWSQNPCPVPSLRSSLLSLSHQNEGLVTGQDLWITGWVKEDSHLLAVRQSPATLA